MRVHAHLYSRLTRLPTSPSAHAARNCCTNGCSREDGAAGAGADRPSELATPRRADRQAPALLPNDNFYAITLGDASPAAERRYGAESHARASEPMIERSLP